MNLALNFVRKIEIFFITNKTFLNKFKIIIKMDDSLIVETDKFAQEMYEEINEIFEAKRIA